MNKVGGAHFAPEGQKAALRANQMNFINSKNRNNANSQNLMAAGRNSNEVIIIFKMPRLQNKRGIL